MKPQVVDNVVINETSYFNLFNCNKNISYRLDSMCEQARMATSIDRYYMEMYKTLTDYNDCNNKPLQNKNIREAIHKVIEEESILDANNVTSDTFSHTYNTQRENEKMIFTSEKLDKLDGLVDA